MKKLVWILAVCVLLFGCIGGTPGGEGTTPSGNESAAGEVATPPAGSGTSGGEVTTPAEEPATPPATETPTGETGGAGATGDTGTTIGGGACVPGVSYDYQGVTMSTVGPTTYRSAAACQYIITDQSSGKTIDYYIANDGSFVCVVMDIGGGQTYAQCTDSEGNILP